MKILISEAATIFVLSWVKNDLAPLTAKLVTSIDKIEMICISNFFPQMTLTMLVCHLKNVLCRGI